MKHFKLIKKEEIIMRGLVACLNGIERHDDHLWVVFVWKSEGQELGEDLKVSWYVKRALIVCNSRSEAGGADGVMSELLANGLRSQLLNESLESLAHCLTVQGNELVVLVNE